MEATTDKLNAEVDAHERQQESLGLREAAQKVSEGRKAHAAAEGAAAYAFAARRAQEQEMRKLVILEKLSENPNVSVVTSLENNTGLAPNNSLVAQITQQGMEAFRMKLAEVTSGAATTLGMGSTNAGGLVRPVPKQEQMRQ